MPAARQSHRGGRPTWIAFFDSSALIKRYTEEMGSRQIDKIFNRIPKNLVICPIAVIAETISVLVRKKNDGRIHRQFFEQATLSLYRDFIESPKDVSIPMDEVLVLDSLELIFKHHINATDALILHLALHVRAQIRPETQKQLLFLTADKRLARAARSEALVVCDPETGDAELLSRLIEPV